MSVWRKLLMHLIPSPEGWEQTQTIESLRGLVAELESQRRLWLDTDSNARVMLQMEREIMRLERELIEAKTRQISWFDWDYPPIAQQGEPNHEVLDYLTADTVNGLVKRIVELEAQLGHRCGAAGEPGHGGVTP